MDTVALYKFLEDLDSHNNREWFTEHKNHWNDLRAQWMSDVDLLIAKMSSWEPAFSHLTAKDCTFRIYRDIRFKTDKSPYKTWVSGGFSIYGKNTHKGGYYIQLGPQTKLSDGFSGLFGGVWQPETPMLNKLRKAIVDNFEEFLEIVNNKELNKYFPGWTGSKLKRIPRGWDENIPAAEFLKLKEFGKAMECDQKFFQGDWTTRTSEKLRLLKPLVDFLNYSIEE